MKRITENDISILKRYLPIEEILSKFEIVPIEEIAKVLKNGMSKNLSGAEMAEKLGLDRDRIYYYTKRLREGKSLVIEKDIEVDDAIILNCLNYFKGHVKESGKVWHLQDLIVYLQDYTEERPSESWVSKRLIKMNINWSDYSGRF